MVRLDSHQGVATRFSQIDTGCASMTQIKIGSFIMMVDEKVDGSYGYEKVDGIFNLGAGRMFCSGANGSIYRLDTTTGMGTYLFTPIKGPQEADCLHCGWDMMVMLMASLAGMEIVKSSI